MNLFVRSAHFARTSVLILSVHVFVLAPASWAIAGQSELALLLEQPYAPTLYEYLEAMGGVVPEKNPYLHYTSLTRWKLSYLPSDVVTEVETVSQGASSVVERIESLFPGAIWITLGRDTEAFAHALEGYYLRRGESDRVQRLRVSNGSVASHKIAAITTQYLKQIGFSHSKRPFIFLDRTRYQATSQVRMFIRAVYQTMTGRMFAVRGIDEEREALFRRINVLALGYTGDPVYHSNAKTFEEFVIEHRMTGALKPEIEPERVISVGKVMEDYLSDQYSHPYGPFEIKESGLAGPTAGKGYSIAARIKYMIALHELARIFYGRTDAEHFFAVKSDPKTLTELRYLWLLRQNNFSYDMAHTASLADPNHTIVEARTLAFLRRYKVDIERLAEGERSQLQGEIKASLEKVRTRGSQFFVTSCDAIFKS